MQDHPDERLNLVDDQDRVIGQARRSEVYRAGWVNFRVVNAFLVNAAGQLWIPRRAATKRIFPLCLDVSMGGHVESGEKYEDALRRELREELNLDLDRQAWRCVAYLSPYGQPLSAFMKVYTIATDQAPDDNPADFVEAFWGSPAEVLARIASGDRAKGDLPTLIRLLFVWGVQFRQRDALVAVVEFQAEDVTAGEIDDQGAVGKKSTGSDR